MTLVMACMLAMCKQPGMTTMSSPHILVNMLARAAAGGAERKHFLKQVVTTPDASMVIGERFYAASHLQRPLTHHVLPVQHFLPVPCRLPLVHA